MSRPYLTHKLPFSKLTELQTDFSLMHTHGVLLSKPFPKAGSVPQVQQVAEGAVSEHLKAYLGMSIHLRDTLLAVSLGLAKVSWCSYAGASRALTVPV